MTAPCTAKGGTRGKVYGEVARLRIQDAECLLVNRRNNGAIYLAGYAVECQLKYAYCQRKDSVYLPGNLEVHDWDRLVNEAGLRKDIKAQPKMEALYSALVDQWGPGLRYRPADYSISEANRLYNELNQLYKFLSELVP